MEEIKMSVAGPENQLDCDKPESRAEDHPGHGHWATLVLLADCVDDLEKVRIANENRYRSLTSQEDWGKGVLPGPDEVVMIEASIDGLKLMEKTAVKTLEKGMAAHPLGPWVKSQLGLGMKTVGRYLALVGD
ncbi:MAG: hypothetical protein GY719_20350, partial [bacterium]|nr:hypothetical protein [bacterium]